MFCNNCGKQIPDGSTSCPECGVILGETEKTIGIWDGGAMVAAPGAVADDANKVESDYKVGFGAAVGMLFKNYFN